MEFRISPRGLDRLQNPEKYTFTKEEQDQILARRTQGGIQIDRTVLQQPSLETLCLISAQAADRHKLQIDVPVVRETTVCPYCGGVNCDCDKQARGGRVLNRHYEQHADSVTLTVEGILSLDMQNQFLAKLSNFLLDQQLLTKFIYRTNLYERTSTLYVELQKEAVEVFKDAVSRIQIGNMRFSAHIKPT